MLNISIRNYRFYIKEKRLERVRSQTPHEVSWTPILWAMKLLARAKQDGKIKIEPPSYANLQASFEQIECVNRKLLRYAWVNFPLAYTQVCLALAEEMNISVFLHNFNLKSSMTYFLFPGCKFSSFYLFHSLFV